jgi:hypothetical protein
VQYQTNATSIVTTGSMLGQHATSSYYQWRGSGGGEGGMLQVDQTCTPPIGLCLVVPSHKVISWSSLPRPLERLGRCWHVHSPPRHRLFRRDQISDVRPQET